MPNPTNLKSWTALVEHYKTAKNLNMKEMFNSDSKRFERFSLEFNDILFDYSKNIIDEETLKLLLDLAEEANLKAWQEKMIAGEKINSTENRAVQHVALRNLANIPIKIDHTDIMPKVKTVLGQMKRFVESVHSGESKGCTGKKITDIVNIGIGGSDLGPAMVCNALKPYANKGINVHFVSNIDGTNINETLKILDPTTTLFIIASKSFSTQETLVNAQSAKKWFLKNAAKHGTDVAKHFIAISTNEPEVIKFGIDTKNMFGFWNWVGGRYSLWSAIGMSIALYVGYDNFEKLLKGAEAADQHFFNRPFAKNIPVIMALLGVWYSNFFETKTHAIIPYDQYLALLPAYLQQLDMESNGKYISKNNEIINYTTAPVIWGQTGTNAQHSFFQLIHQGTQIIPADFLAPATNHNEISEHQRILLSNFFAQTEALMNGQTEEEVLEAFKAKGKPQDEIERTLKHNVFTGNKPTNSFLYKKLTPETLGSIIAFYEHKVFVQGVIWNINSFDQWGVELGKKLAKTVLQDISNDLPVNNHDSSTNGLINWYKKAKV